MKNPVLYAVALAGFTIFSSYSMVPNVPNAHLTANDLDAIKSTIRNELDSIRNLILAGNIAQAQTRLNSQQLIQQVRNYPSFYRIYKSLESRANQNAPAGGAARRLNFNATNRPN